MLSLVIVPVVTSKTNDPLAEPPGVPKVTFDSVKVTKVSALAAVDPTNTAMIEDAASAALSFDFMSRSPFCDEPAAATSHSPVNAAATQLNL
jgi:hypothetical protein